MCQVVQYHFVIVSRKVFRNKDLYVKYSGIRSYAPDFALIARLRAWWLHGVCLQRGVPVSRVSLFQFFKEPKSRFQRTKSRFQRTNRAGRFVRSVFMVGLFGRLSQGLLRGENEFDWRAAAKVVESGNVHSLFYA